MSQEEEVKADPMKVKGFETDPAAQAIAEQAMKEMQVQDGRPVAISFSVHGEVIVRRFFPTKDPKEYNDLLDDLEEVDYEEISLSKELHAAMEDLFEATKQIERLPKREIPLTRSELGKAVPISKMQVRRLAKKKLVTERLIRLNVSKTGKAARAQSVLYFTPQGRAYATKHFDGQFYKGLIDARRAKEESDS